VVMAPFMRQMQRYQLFLSGAWRDLVILVLTQMAKYNGSKSFTDMGADVTTDALVDVSMEDIGTATEALNKTMAVGAPKELLVRMAIQLMSMTLQVLGVADGNKILGIEDGIPDEWIPDEDDESPEPPNDNDDSEEPEPDDEDDDDDDAEETGLDESHKAEELNIMCPLGCGGEKALAYPGHKGLLVCVSCNKTFDPEIERWQPNGE